jgi:hypothetical protein
MKKIKIIFEDGDYIVTRINATPKEIKEYYSKGEYMNVGEGARDSYKKIKTIKIY